MTHSDIVHEIKVFNWPYPLKYEKTNHIYVDVLVVGGGLAGCCAGMAAARKGASVAVADKAPIKRSGCGGAGLDHYNGIFENPNSPMSAEEVVENADHYGGLAHRDYIAIKGCWEALLELERLGLQIRDKDRVFEGTPTKDAESGLLKAFDYKNLTSVKLVGGQYIKPTVYSGLVREKNVSLFERCMITSVFNENGRRGARIAGAAGFSMETGEFYVFHAKTVILSTGYVCSCWISNLDITGNSYRWDPNEVGEGMALSWKAGAEIFGMHRNGGTRAATPFAWPRFGVGNPNNTWFPCTIVDNNGKKIPWQDAEGNIIEGEAQRNIPIVDGAFYGGGLSWRSVNGKSNLTPNLISDLGDRIKNGEYELPLWADLSDLGDEEKRSIWGVMIGNEGKSRYTVYDYYTRLGFNPDKHMLMAPIMQPDNYLKSGGWFHGEPNAAPTWRTEYRNQGEVACDWDLMTSVEGLYVAGATGGLEGSGFACSSGFYAGARAAEFAAGHVRAKLLKEDVMKERERILRPLSVSEGHERSVSWKEVWAGSARVMQQCCAAVKTETVLQLGLDWLASIRDTELPMVYARNPHELARAIECETRISCSEVFIHACLGKLKAEKVGTDKGKYLFCRLDEDGVKDIIREDKYWLHGNNKATYLENYLEHTRNERGEK